MHILPVKIIRYLIFRFCKILSIIWRNVTSPQKKKKGMEFVKKIIYLPSRIWLHYSEPIHRIKKLQMLILHFS